MCNCPDPSLNLCDDILGHPEQELWKLAKLEPDPTARKFLVRQLMSNLSFVQLEAVAQRIDKWESAQPRICSCCGGEVWTN